MQDANVTLAPLAASRYFHNGVALSLEAVVVLYNTRTHLQLTAQQQTDLVQYLKSL